MFMHLSVPYPVTEDSLDRPAGIADRSVVNAWCNG